MAPQHSFFTFTLLSLFFSLISAQTYSLEEGGTQFIYYNGSLSGSFRHDPPTVSTSSCGDNGVYYFTNISNAFMRIGKNPPWDTNPFFFSISREGRRSENVSLWDVRFASTYYLCFKDGKRCGQLEFWPWYYETAQQVNISAAEISVEKEGDQGPFYKVRHDNAVWLGRDIVKWNNLQFQTAGNYSGVRGNNCARAFFYEWFVSLFLSLSLFLSFFSSVSLQDIDG